MEKRFTDAEITQLKSMFPDDKTIKLLRKVFIPEITIDAPINGQENIFLGTDVETLTIEEQVINLKAAKRFIARLEGGMNVIKQMTAQVEVTPEEKAKKAKANSTE